MRWKSNGLAGKCAFDGPRQRCDGFSLLEVLVAFAILALSMGVLLQVFSSSLRGQAVADEYFRALVLAESKLEEIGARVPLDPGQLHGDMDGHYQWKATIEEFEREQGGAGAGVLSAQRIAVEVAWDGGPGGPKSLMLQTVRLKPLPTNRGKRRPPSIQRRAASR